ncbi:MAG: hypothetical protein HQM08_07445 [Candidatus Riflebacteria bacterium]|nr:hypothetical protein [Candidatus Riflebacteria bacterium]
MGKSLKFTLVLVFGILIFSSSTLIAWPWSENEKVVIPSQATTSNPSPSVETSAAVATETSSPSPNSLENKSFWDFIWHAKMTDAQVQIGVPGTPISFLIVLPSDGDRKKVQLQVRGATEVYSAKATVNPDGSTQFTVGIPGTPASILVKIPADFDPNKIQVLLGGSAGPYSGNVELTSTGGTKATADFGFSIYLPVFGVAGPSVRVGAKGDASDPSHYVPEGYAIITFALGIPLTGVKLHSPGIEIPLGDVKYMYDVTSSTTAQISNLVNSAWTGITGTSGK